MRKLFISILLALAAAVGAQAQTTPATSVVADEGAWCWFADPRALHYENASGTINSTYIGYIDVHGNVKATQYDWVRHRKTDVLIRSYFQPDDHNNPTFVVLPDERVMIFYTRHTDEACIWYRISQKPGDITALGEEKRLATANNTTYPSPFILSDDPNHIYLCWRGINWHPTIARLTMPDAAGNCSFDFGPKQIVQSTGARPYAKYQSNGKDKIYLSYTTGHPDNEQPDWLYLNVIDINHGNGPILRDVKGNQLSVIANGVHNVNKQDSYASAHPAAIVDNTANIRNWVWQIVLDKDENPVIAYPHIDGAKTTHVYWYARWTGTEWRRTWVQYGGHAFHKNWNSTERCYSGGMSLDPDNINDLYLSIPTTNGQYNKDGVYEIWKYTIDDAGTVAGSEQITKNSTKNNVRPFIIPGSKNSPMRLAWMNGDYYYWMVQQNYPKGYPTAIHCAYDWKEELTPENVPAEIPTCICFWKDMTMTMAFAMDENHYEGTLFTISDNTPLTYSIGADSYPVVTIGNKSYRSQNRLLTSDAWATGSTGTSGDNHPTKLSTWVLTLTYDGKTLTTYRNGLVDQVITPETTIGGVVENIAGHDDGGNAIPSPHTLLTREMYYACASPLTVQTFVKEAQTQLQKEAAKNALMLLDLPEETRTDLVLPASKLGLDIKWTSSDVSVISNNGVLFATAADKTVTLTATAGSESRTFTVKALARDIAKNLRYSKEAIDMTANTATGFAANTTVTAPAGLLAGLRSYTFLVTVTPKTMLKQPRIYDFGSGSGNSIFLRADALSAGVKYNGGTTTMVNSTTKLKAGTEYKLAVTYNAATHTTTIYINGEENVSGTANQVEAYQLAELAADTRNYIGRTQWWDGDYKADNQDFCGTISNFRLYDACLTRQEICKMQDIAYEQDELPTALQNGDFEDAYSVQAGSGVSSDRAIYVPEGWTVDRANPNENDITALKSGDKYFDQFFGAMPKPSAESTQTYWIRHNWGTPTQTLKQRLRLPEGRYALNCDIWKSGLGGDASVSVQTEGGTTVSSPALENKSEWQHVELDFNSDGTAPTTIILTAMHNSSGSEKIIGFDNISIRKHHAVGIGATRQDATQPHDDTRQTWYDLSGRRIQTPTRHGIYIHGKRKALR